MRVNNRIALLCMVALFFSLMPIPTVGASTIIEDSKIYGEIQLSNVTDTSAYLNASNLVSAIKNTNYEPRLIKWYLKDGTGSIALTESGSVTDESALCYTMTNLTPGTSYEPFVMITYFDMENGEQHIYKSYSSFTTTGVAPTSIPSATPLSTPVVSATPTATSTPVVSEKPSTVVKLARPKLKGTILSGDTVASLISMDMSDIDPLKYNVTYEYLIKTKSGGLIKKGPSYGDIITTIESSAVMSLQVRAVVVDPDTGKNIYSKWSKKKWMISEPDNIRVKTRGKKAKRRVKISWKSVYEADEYTVCYRKHGATKWKTLCTTKKTSCKSRKLVGKSIDVCVIAKSKVKGKTIKSDMYCNVWYKVKKK